MKDKRKWMMWLAGTFLCLALVVAAYAGYELLTGNLHQLPDGKVLRSGQLSSAQLERLIRDHQLRSVLNLRGSSKSDWYRAETNVCAALGVEHASVKLSARRKLTEAEMENLVELLRDLPKPMLVHCTGGADRTSLACALYRLDVAGEMPETAAGELGILYGHIPHLKWRYSIAMDQSFWSHVTNHTAATHRF